MKNFNFNYDSENDNLFVYLEGKKSEGAVELGNVILDFDDNYNLVAMQILNVTDFFQRFFQRGLNYQGYKK